MNFRNLLTPEQRRELDRRQRQLTDDAARLAALSNVELAVTLAYYINNSEKPRWPPGTNVYDAVLWYSVLPEIFRRLAPDSGLEKPEDVTQEVFTNIVGASWRAWQDKKTKAD